MADPLKDKYWEWFALHSGQRMQSVNFFLVVVGFLVAGYIDAVTGSRYWVALLVSLLGVATAYLFYMLDRRTRRLVKAVENRWMNGSTGGTDSSSGDAETLIQEVDRPAIGNLTYSNVFFWFYLAVGTFFFMAGCYTISKLTATSPPSAPDLRRTLAASMAIIWLFASVQILRFCISPPKPKHEDDGLSTAQFATAIVFGVLLLALAACLAFMAVR